MKSLILPDVHLHYKPVERFLHYFEQDYDEIVHLGDHYDKYGDSVAETIETALWVKSIINNPKHHFLLSNHDISYRFPNNHYFHGYGFSKEKSDAINAIITKEDWKKFKLLHKTQGYYCSHAGITRFAFDDKLADKFLFRRCEEALYNAEINLYDKVLGAGKIRGGMQTVGGIIWAHWSNELKPIPNFKQIVGHTMCSSPLSEYFPNKKKSVGENHCIDCGGKYYGVIHNGIFSTINIMNLSL